jgi:hypothetical protein
MNHKISSSLFILIFAIIGYSQTTDSGEVKIRTANPVISTSPVITTSGILSTSNVKLIKNSPFSAEGVSESVQILQDGNRIVRKSSVKMFRDSEGRFRQEGSGSTGARVSGGWALRSFSGSGKSVYIYDPVESVRYTLDLDKKTARRSQVRSYSGRFLFPEGSGTVKPTAKKSAELKKKEEELRKRLVELRVTVGNIARVTVGNIAGLSDRESNTESLGTKFFDGVEAEGTKTIVTIKAGAIGNERPIETVYEKWYSKELGMIVYSRNFDPRYGEQIYRLINIDRTEPDRTLFVVPADFEILKNKEHTLTYIAKPKK